MNLTRTMDPLRSTSQTNSSDEPQNFQDGLVDVAAFARSEINAETVALWLFDEQEGLYPSCVLGDAASGDFPLVIGLGGQLLEGKFGRGLEPALQPDRNVITEQISQDIGGKLRQLANPTGSPEARSICPGPTRFSAD